MTVACFVCCSKQTAPPENTMLRSPDDAAQVLAPVRAHAGKNPHNIFVYEFFLLTQPSNDNIQHSLKFTYKHKQIILILLFIKRFVYF